MKCDESVRRNVANPFGEMWRTCSVKCSSSLGRGDVPSAKGREERQIGRTLTGTHGERQKWVNPDLGPLRFHPEDFPLAATAFVICPSDKGQRRGERKVCTTPLRFQQLLKIRPHDLHRLTKFNAVCIRRIGTVAIPMASHVI